MKLIQCAVLLAASVLVSTSETTYLDNDFKEYTLRHSGEDVKLSCCYIYGAGEEVKFAWKKDSSKFIGQIQKFNDICELVLLKNLSTSDGGEYQCETCNYYECATDTYLLVVDTLIEETLMVNRTAKLHALENLHCYLKFDLEKIKRDFYGNLSIEWIKHHVNDPTNPRIPADVVRMPSDSTTDNALNINYVSSKDEGWYTCVVSSMLGVNYKSIYLKVENVVPTFPEAYIRNKANIFRQIGDSVHLDCQRGGNMPSDMFWLKDAHFLSDTELERIKFVNHALLMYDLTTRDIGEYECYNCNLNRCNISTFALNVGTMRNITARACSTTTLNCKASVKEDLSKASIEWIKSYVKHGDPKHMGSHKKVSSEIVESKEYLTITHLTPADEGWYTCVVNGDNAMSYRSIYLRVVYEQVFAPAEIAEINWSGLAKTGDKVELSCAADGFPKPLITWTKNRQEIRRSSGAIQYVNASIILDSVVSSDGGDYECNVCNDLGCVNRSYRLIVDTIFTFDLMGNITVNEYSPAIFECPTIFGDFSPYDTYWYKNHGCADEQQDNVAMLNSDFTLKHLTLPNVTRADEGWYKCCVLEYCKCAYLHVITPKNSTTFVATIVLSCLVLVVFTIIIAVFQLRRWRKAFQTYWIKKVTVVRENSDLRQDFQMPTVTIERLQVSASQGRDRSNAIKYEYKFPLDPDWEIPRSELILNQQLGEGVFGRVMLAEMQGIPNGSTIASNVAVKMLKDGHTDCDVKALICELEALKVIGKHPNIINLLGCCSQDGPLFVIIEFAPHGDLQSYLRGHQLKLPEEEINSTMSDYYLRRTISTNQLITFAVQIARGMEHLASRMCVHRDLAARNVLVGVGHIMKICDFGLARDIYVSDYYRKKTTGRVPFRWMAPESLELDFYSTQSDVWSFGVLLWEIMTLGGHPFATILAWDDLVEHLRRGKRLAQPSSCPDAVYQRMIECWRYQREDRPTFRELGLYLEQLVVTEESYVDDENYEHYYTMQSSL